MRNLCSKLHFKIDFVDVNNFILYLKKIQLYYNREIGCKSTHVY